MAAFLHLRLNQLQGIIVVNKGSVPKFAGKYQHSYFYFMKLHSTLAGVVCLLLALATAFEASAQRGPRTKRTVKQRTTTLQRNDAWRGSGVNLKLMPAFHANTVGLEFEAPVSERLSLGVNLLGKYAKTDADKRDPKVNAEDNLAYGYLLEGAAKYYFDLAPRGLYAQGSLGFGTLYYASGEYRPYSLLSTGRSFEGAGKDVPYVPTGLRAGIGLGYQFIIVPRFMVANVMLGVQGVGTDDGFKPSIFANPSVGIIF